MRRGASVSVAKDDTPVCPASFRRRHRKHNIIVEHAVVFHRAPPFLRCETHTVREYIISSLQAVRDPTLIRSMTPAYQAPLHSKGGFVSRIRPCHGATTAATSSHSNRPAL